VREVLALDVVRVLAVEFADGFAEGIGSDGAAGGEVVACGGGFALRRGTPVF